VWSGAAWAQARPGFGAVTGTILEAAGDGLPDTTVVVSNPASGLRRVMVTTDDGVFGDATLVPGTGYRLKVSRKGFDNWESAEFEVSVGRTLEFTVTLKHSAESGRDEGSIPAPRIREVDRSIIGSVTAQQVNWLPTRERRLDPLALTAPLTGTDDRSGRLVVAGVQPSNLFLTDGIASTNTYSGSTPGIANQLSQDAVQEFQVLSANYTAEFGDAMGGVVNAVTRSGSNGYHGAGYEYFRNGSLAAANRYALGQNLLRHQNQFGASLGGPIRRDRIFFFSNFEVLDGHGQGLNRITSPALADASGTSIPSANCKATTVQCTAALKFLQSQMNVLTPLSDHWTTGFAKVDYRRSERNSISLTANAMNARSPEGGSIQDVAPNGGLLGIGDSKDRVRDAQAAWTSAPTASSVNLLRFGFFQDHLFDPASAAHLTTGGAAVTVAGVTVGNPYPNSTMLSEQRYQLADSFTVTSNTHTFTAGADLWRTRDSLDSLAGPSYVYNSLTAFAQDLSSGGKDYTSFTQTLGTSLRRLPVREYNYYALDTWKPFSSVTIVAGVRWEKPRLPQPTEVASSYYQTATIATPNIDFAPRLSLAYQAAPRTVVRIGYGWFYEPMPGQLLDTLFLGNGIYQTSLTVNPNQTGAPVFPNGVSSTSIPANTTNLMYGSSKLRNPYVRQTSLALERTLSRDTTLTVSLLHNRGYKLWSLTDINLVAPTVSKTYAVDNAAGQQVSSYTTLLWNTRNDGTHAHVYNVLNGGSSWYNAAVVELRRRMSHDLSVQATYTWSHAIDDVGGPLVAGALPLNTTNGDVAADRATSPTDQRHRAVVNWTWQPTQRFLKGWTVSGITTLASGHPATPVVLVAGQQFSGVTMLYTSSLDGSGGWDRVPFSQIASLNTGPQYNVDARLSRSFHIGERVQAILAFDAFNAFNTQYDTAVNTVAFTATPTAPPSGAVSGPTTGIIKPVAGVGSGSAAGPARVGQIALRLVF
jgi:hypothetical protein